MRFNNSIRLGRAVTIYKGRKYEISENGKNRYINIEDLHNPNNLIKTDGDGMICEFDDVIIAWDGANAGKVGVGYNGVVGSTLAILKNLSSNLTGRFLFWFLEFKNPEIVLNRTGATIPHVNGTHLRSIEIPLPPLAEQKAIAEKLDIADALRKKDQELLKYYDELAQSVFIDMFGDPVKNEKGWEKVKTNNFTTKLGDGLHGTPKYSDVGEYFFVNGNNIKNKKIEISEKTRRVDEHEFEKYKKDLNENTVFVSINGTLGSVGFFNNENIVLGKSVCYFNIDPEIADKQYIYHCFDNEYFKRYAEENATGSTIKNVSLKSMREFEVMLPPLSLQQKFANIIENIEEQKKKVKLQAQESENLFQALLQESFS